MKIPGLGPSRKRAISVSGMKRDLAKPLRIKNLTNYNGRKF